ncbi:MAG: response regulator [Acidimicrobiia bacterium]
MHAEAQRPLRVLLVDDHEVVRRGLRALLEAQDGIEVVGEVDTAADVVRQVGFNSPDVVVMDVRLPDGSGVEATRKVRQRFPDVAVLILSSFADEEALMSSIEAGASGYLLKRIDTEAIVNAVRAVGAGESLLDPAMTEKLFNNLRDADHDDDLISKLSGQERRILTRLAEGKTNREIASEMYLAEKTVKNYVSNLLAKMGMARRSQAAAYAARVEERRQHHYAPEEWGET